MQLVSLVLLVAATLVDSASAANIGDMCTDGQCGQNSLCVPVINDLGIEIKMCAPNTIDYPACGGKVPGRCPPDGPDVHDAHCAFVDDVKLMQLQFGYESKGGQYKCVSKKQCETWSVKMIMCNFPDCRSEINNKICTGNGTCTYTYGTASKDTESRCMCNDGYTGTHCEDVDVNLGTSSCKKMKAGGFGCTIPTCESGCYKGVCKEVERGKQSACFCPLNTEVLCPGQPQNCSMCAKL